MEEYMTNEISKIGIPEDVLNGFKLLLKHFKVNIDVKQRNYRLKVERVPFETEKIKLSAWHRLKTGEYKEVNPKECILKWMEDTSFNKINSKAEIIG